MLCLCLMGDGAGRAAMEGIPSYRAVTAKLVAGHPRGILVDIYGLIWLNDQLGFEAGDRAITQVFGIVAAVVGDHRGHVFRIGGEEFLALFPPGDDESLALLAHQLLAAVCEADIPYRRRDEPENTRLTVNAALLRLTPQLLESSLGEWGVTGAFREWFGTAMYERRQATRGHSGVVADLRDEPWPPRGGHRASS